MRKLIYILWVFVVVGIASCSHVATRHSKSIDDAEKLMENNVDSAMSILDAIEPSELHVDLVRAKYHYLKAWGHLRQNRYPPPTSKPKLVTEKPR